MSGLLLSLKISRRLYLLHRPSVLEIRVSSVSGVEAAASDTLDAVFPQHSHSRSCELQVAGPVYGAK